MRSAVFKALTCQTAVCYFNVQCCKFSNLSRIAYDRLISWVQ